MTTYASNQYVLRSRPTGQLTPGNFQLQRVELDEPREGQVIVANRWLSVDPYMRRRMNGGRFYAPPFEVGRPLSGGAVGEVIASGSERLPVGTLVKHEGGWRDVARVREEHTEVVDATIASPSAFLGVLGMPGLTAFVGLTDIAGLQENDTVFVSGAAGAVGSLAGQLARLRGHRVVGSAGSAEKVAWLTGELGFDAAFDYHDDDVTVLLDRVTPDGIDVYFDNVGDDHLQAAIAAANDGARFALCGSIADYNDAVPRPGPSNLFEVIARRIRMQGFIVSDHADRREAFLAEVGPLVGDGSIRFRETVVDGLDRAPAALMSLFEGANVGKMLVRL